MLQPWRERKRASALQEIENHQFGAASNFANDTRYRGSLAEVIRDGGLSDRALNALMTLICSANGESPQGFWLEKGRITSLADISKFTFEDLTKMVDGCGHATAREIRDFLASQGVELLHEQHK